MTDIVKRLRSLNEGNRWPMMDEAADEIERLRKTAIETMQEMLRRANEIERLRADAQNGNRPLPFQRDEFGHMVRETWVRWAHTQPNPKPSWLVPYDELPEPDKEADRQIGEAVARWTLIGDAARRALEPKR